MVLSKGDESCPAAHPLGEWEEFADIRLQLEQLEEQYKGNFDELRITGCQKSFGYGAVNYWYELQGRYTDPTKMVLYGVQEES